MRLCTLYSQRWVFSLYSVRALGKCYLAVPYITCPLLIPLQTSPVVERQLLHHTEEQARRDVELANTKRAKLELEESLREYQAR